ncbi:MAG: toxin-activating lysine-acyltransferase [Hyphomicrobiaceae bacterium]|nr:MAG: toxin-activating lysine-acyltransferase [Hyphomicrobiaceae bacterium]
MRSPRYKHVSLADLEWLVLPAIRRGQVIIARSRRKPTDAPVPVAVAIWAVVSPEVDQRLSATPVDTPLRLEPQVWRSGDIAWIVVAEGAGPALAAVVKALREGVLKGRVVKARMADSNRHSSTVILSDNQGAHGRVSGS